MARKYWVIKSPHVKCPDCGCLLGVKMNVSSTRVYRDKTVIAAKSSEGMEE